MDKSAIYCYYKDFDGLLSTYIEKQDYWLLSIKEYSTESELSKELVEKILREPFMTLSNNPEFQELIMWEVADKNNIAAPLTVKREIYSQKILE